jgi:glycosyltransferase involved in cell wall biosynthesis
MTPDFVSVIVPAFNAEQYIEECINSVIAQTYQNIEIIVINDGSIDQTRHKVEQLHNDKIRLFNINNSGAAGARNYGIEQAKGEWIAFLDADDIWLPEKLETQLQYCKGANWSHTDFFYTGYVYEDKTLGSSLTKKYGGNIFEALLQDNFVGTSDVIVKKAIVQKLGGFDPQYRYLEDWDLWLKIAADHEICYCDKPLSLYRTHAGSVSRAARKTLPYHVRLIENVFSSGGIGEQYLYLRNRALFNSYSVNSYISEQESDLGFSVYCAFMAIRYRPFEVAVYVRFIKQIIKKVLS